MSKPYYRVEESSRSPDSPGHVEMSAPALVFRQVAHSSRPMVSKPYYRVEESSRSPDSPGHVEMSAPALVFRQ
ncbi:hypothetical protein CJ738_36240, partial [Klebsiella pneumoniae]